MSADTTQTWNAQQYAQAARFVSDLGLPVVELLAPRAGERILDLGCGDGPLTKKLLDLGCDVVGVDASADMILAAQKLGLDARVMNGHALQFDAEFDAVFSNAALHWMTLPEQVIAGVWRALKPGGRFVGEFGGAGNVATIVHALEDELTKRGCNAGRANPWYFPSVEQYSVRLLQQGFQIENIALIPRPTPLPGNILAWLETFAKSFTALLPATDHADYLEHVVQRCKPVLCDIDGNWHADYVRLRFAARRPID